MIMTKKNTVSAGVNDAGLSMLSNFDKLWNAFQESKSLVKGMNIV